jgi:hypothetical protein
VTMTDEEARAYVAEMRRNIKEAEADGFSTGERTMRFLDFVDKFLDDKADGGADADSYKPNPSTTRA